MAVYGPDHRRSGVHRDGSWAEELMGRRPEPWEREIQRNQEEEVQEAQRLGDTKGASLVDTEEADTEDQRKAEIGRQRLLRKEEQPSPRLTHLSQPW